MKLTKRVLEQHHIHNPYNLAEKAGSKIYIDYIPADNGRLTARYAFWTTYRLDFLRPENKTKEGAKQFVVRSRDEKEMILKEAIEWVKRFYNIEISEKDVFSAWHPKGTLKKLSNVLIIGE